MSPSEDQSEQRRDTVVPMVAADGPKHSNIFSELTADEGDLVGLVAYGLYKRRKRAWIEDFSQERSRHPTPQECAEFSYGFRKDAIEALRKEAEGAMATFAEQVVENNIQEMRYSALDMQIQATLRTIDGRLSKLGSYRHHVIGHLLGFVILVGIVAFGTFIVRFEPSIDGAYNWVFGQTHASAENRPLPNSN